MYHGNGALVSSNGRVSRQVAMLNRIEFVSEADLLVKQQADQDELQTAKLAAKVTQAKRAMEKYQGGLIAIADLLLCTESEDLSAAEMAVMEALMREHQAVMAAAISEFCGSNVDASKIVTADIERLRESLHGGNGRRRKAMKPSDGFSVQED